MAKLAAVVDALDSVPESFRELYVEADGKYRLDADGVEDVSGLKSTLEKLKREAKDAASALKRYEGIDPDRFAELQQIAEEAETSKLTEVERVQKKYEREMGKLTEGLSKRDSFIERLTIENELNAAIERLEVLPEHRRAVRAMLKEAGAKVVHEGDEYRGYLGDVPIADAVAEWAKSDDAAPYLPASGATGSGARASGGGSGRKALKDMSEKEKAEFTAAHGLDEFLKLVAAG